MKRIFVFSAAVLFLTSSLSASPRAYAGKWDNLITESSKVLDEMNSMPDTSIPTDMLRKCKAVAIFPSTVSGGFIFGAKYGQGVILYKSGNNWSAPAVFNIGGGSWGWQIGGQATDIILLIMSDRGVDGLLQSKLTLGGDAAASAGPVGRDSQASTDLQFKGGILSYARSRGAFIGIKLEGTAIYQNKEGNSALYNKDFTASDILKGGKVKPTAAGAQLIADLNKYSK